MAVDPVQNLINEIKDLKRRIKVLETSPSQQNMTVDKGATRILSDEGLQVGEPGSSTGSQIVYGVLTIVGTLNGDGTITWEGTINQVGPTNLRGPVAITGENGTLTVDAETLLRALTRVLADLQVESGGKITAGNVVIEPNKITIGTAPTMATIQNGEFELANGAKLAVGMTGGTSSIGLIPEGGVVDISANNITAWMRAAGASMSVSSGIAEIDAEFVLVPSIPLKPPTLTTVAVVMDPTNGRLYQA